MLCGSAVFLLFYNALGIYAYNGIVEVMSSILIGSTKQIKGLAGNC